jgi:diacylglycerol kinase family enzyme
MPIKSASIILNQRSGKLLGDHGPKAARRLEKMCREAGLRADIALVHPRHLEAAVRKASKSGAEAVVVAGGDGTIRTAARILAFKETPLGILPLGTRNRMSRALGIPDDPGEAIRALAAGSVRAADIGEVNGHIFVFTSMFGVFNRFGRHREEHRGRSLLLEFPAAGLAVLRELLAARYREMEIIANGSLIRTRSCVFAVTNNPFTPAGVGGQPRLESLDSGRLGFYMSRHQGRLGLLRLVGELLMGKWDADPQVVQKIVPELTVRMRGGAPVEIMNDGEFLHLEAPLYYRTRPGALRILVPEGWDRAHQGAGASIADTAPAAGPDTPASVAALPSLSVATPLSASLAAAATPADLRLGPDSPLLARGTDGPAA